VWTESKGEPLNILFGGPQAVYVHYFKDIRKGALQFDRVMFATGTASNIKSVRPTVRMAYIR